MMRTMVTLIVVVSFAGCVVAPGGVTGAPLGSIASPPNVGSATLQPSASSEDVETASILGRVVDTELRPIPNASVTIVEHMLTVVTAADGGFRFEGIPVGRKILEAHAFGFESAAKAMELTPAGAGSVLVALEPLEVREAPFHTSFERTFSIALSHSWLTLYVWNGVVQYNERFCSQCSSNISFLPMPASWIAETTWKTTSNAVINTEVGVKFTYHVILESGRRAWDSDQRTMKNRDKVDFGMGANVQRLTALNSVPATFAWLNVTGGFNGLNWEHRFSVWTTFGYVEPLPHDFTALPKD